MVAELFTSSYHICVLQSFLILFHHMKNTGTATAVHNEEGSVPAMEGGVDITLGGSSACTPTAEGDNADDGHAYAISTPQPPGKFTTSVCPQGL